jgi:hypothetical protein
LDVTIGFLILALLAAPVLLLLETRSYQVREARDLTIAQALAEDAFQHIFKVGYATIRNAFPTGSPPTIDSGASNPGGHAMLNPPLSPDAPVQGYYQELGFNRRVEWLWGPDVWTPECLCFQPLRAYRVRVRVTKLSDGNLGTLGYEVTSFLGCTQGACPP